MSEEHLKVKPWPGLTEGQEGQVRELVGRYADVFDTSHVAGGIEGFECEIDTGSHPPLSTHPFAVSPSQRKKIDEKLDRMLGLGIIEPSRSPWSSRFFLVKQPLRIERSSIIDL